MRREGTRVGASVRLLHPLAEGGMGSVWVAEHLALKIKVAVKFIGDALSNDEGAVARFSREATAAAQIRSAHVVQIFDHGVLEDGTPYIVMELLEGTNLGALLRDGRRLPATLTSTIVDQLCRALNRAHAIGIVHRDIKPDNIFISEADGEINIKVLDFGIAKNTADPSIAMTSTGVAVGTPNYMSPEQIVNSKDVDVTSDIWSVGVVAYQCLTGRLPFQASSYGGLCIAISSGRFPRASSMSPEISPAVDHWFEKVLDVDPRQRFRTALETAVRFKHALGFAAREGAAVGLPLRRETVLASAEQLVNGGGVGDIGTTRSSIQATSITSGRLAASNARFSAKKYWFFASSGAVVTLAIAGFFVKTGSQTGEPASAIATIASAKRASVAVESTEAVVAMQEQALVAQVPHEEAPATPPQALDGAAAPFASASLSPTDASHGVPATPSAIAPGHAGPARPRRKDILAP